MDGVDAGVAQNAPADLLVEELHGALLDALV